MQICFVQFPMISHSLIADGWYQQPGVANVWGWGAGGLKAVVN